MNLGDTINTAVLNTQSVEMEVLRFEFASCYSTILLLPPAKDGRAEVSAIL